MGGLTVHLKNDQRQKSECRLRLFRSRGDSLNICSRPENPTQYLANSWDQLALPLLNSEVGDGTENGLANQ